VAIANFTVTGTGPVDQSNYYSGCANLSNWWDLAFGKRDSVCTSCASLVEVDRSRVNSTQATHDPRCVCDLNDDWPVFGDPLHTVNADC